MIKSVIQESELERCVRSFEAALWESSNASVREFAPPKDHPQYLEALAELVRVDIEDRCQRGDRVSVEYYINEFPVLSNEKTQLQKICFEHYRQQLMHGVSVSPSDYTERFGIDHSNWPTSRLSSSRTCDIDRRSDPAIQFPDVGDEFMGFGIVRELGRGAFARVYLANQPSLANRSVVLKVTTERFCESQTLARLQHANIVPIHSVHQWEQYSVICMPFFGASTLRDVIRFASLNCAPPATGALIAESLLAQSNASTTTELLASENHEAIPYVHTVLRLTRKICDGLDHAHQRGIEHCDLKPANILIADDGEPMLLDFNLARQHLDRDSPDGTNFQVGGTLAYMSPEQLILVCGGSRSIADHNDFIDSRCDIYALGVVLFEFLACQHPFPIRKGTSDTVLRLMTADRRHLPDSLRRLNPDVSPAVEAIVLKCLQPDRSLRYQSAKQIAEDIDRHLNHLPLRHIREPSIAERYRKWTKRHSELLSIAGLSAIGLCIIGFLAALLYLRNERLANFQAQQEWHRFQKTFQSAQIEFIDTPVASAESQRSTLQHLETLLARYDSSSRWAERLQPNQRERLESHIADTQFLHSLTQKLYDSDSTRHVIPTPYEVSPSPIRRTCQEACVLASQRRFREALAKWRNAVALDPQSVWVWYGLATCWEHLASPNQAAECYSACIALNPDFFGWYFNLARCHITTGEYNLALQELKRAAKQEPDNAETIANIAICQLKLGLLDQASASIDDAKQLGFDATRAHLLMAEVCRAAGDETQGRHCEELALQSTPSSCDGWIARGNLKVAQRSGEALRDYESGLRLNRYSREGWENCAYVLSERLNRPQDAIRTLDQAIEIFPECCELIASRGVLKARLGLTDESLQDAETAVSRNHSPAVLYRVACVQSLLSPMVPECKSEAMASLKKSLSAGYGINFFQDDPDLSDVRDQPEFAGLVEAISTLHPPSP